VSVLVRAYSAIDGSITVGDQATPGYFSRTRVRTVGTVQITPPLPRKNAPAPFLGAGFFFAQRGRREPAGEQVQPKAQQRTATRSVAISAETNCPALWNNIVV
jgi:hypothetical protein